MNTVVWYPQAMAELCKRALEHNIEPEYVRRFIRSRHLVLETPPIEVEAWPWPVKVRTFGSFELYADDQRVTFSGKAQKKPIDLLKALLSLGGRDVSEEQLTEILWPDSEGDAAHSSFTTTLSRLRQLLGNEKAVVVKDGKASLDQSFCWADVWAFEKMAEDIDKKVGQALAVSGVKRDRRKQESTAVIEFMESAIALYRGSYLPADSSRTWTVSMRERLRSRFLKIVNTAGAIAEQNGQWDRAAASYQRAMEADNLSEELFQRLMACQLKLGRYDEAITTYRRCRHTLMTVFGLTPSEATESLYQSALRKQK